VFGGDLRGGDTHLVVTEGIAILMGRLASDAEWLERVAGVA
jgi:hypothetical protein